MGWEAQANELLSGSNTHKWNKPAKQSGTEVTQVPICISASCVIYCVIKKRFLYSSANEVNSRINRQSHKHFSQ